MTEILIRLMNAPRIIQQSVAFGLLFAAAALFCMALFFAVSGVQDRMDAIQNARGELARLDAILAQRLEETAQAPVDGAGALPFLEGENIALVQAKLQQRLSLISSGSGATIGSMSGVPMSSVDGVSFAGLRLDVDGSLRSMHDLIFQIETSTPPLIVRHAQIRGSSSIQQGVLTEPIQLSGQLSVVGAFDPQKLPMEKRAQ